MAICKSQNGESGSETRGMGAGNKATWRMRMWRIRVRMCRMQEIKVGMREMEWGCSESGLIFVESWVKM